MATKHVRKKVLIIDQDMPIGKLRRIKDLLPTSEKLVFPNNKKSNKS